MFNHTVCNQTLIRINKTNLPWFSFDEPAGVLSLGRVSFIYHLYAKCALLILEDPAKLPVSLLCCCCSLHQTWHSSGAFLLKSPSICSIFLKSKSSLLNPIDSGGHTCCMHPLEWMIFCICWNLPNRFNCSQQLVQPDYVVTVRRCRARGHCRRTLVKKDKSFWKGTENEVSPTEKSKVTSRDNFTLVTFHIIQGFTSPGSFIFITILDLFCFYKCLISS